MVIQKHLHLKTMPNDLVQLLKWDRLSDKKINSVTLKADGRTPNQMLHTIQWTKKLNTVCYQGSAMAATDSTTTPLFMTLNQRSSATQKSPLHLNRGTINTQVQLLTATIEIHLPVSLGMMSKRLTSSQLPMT